MSSDIEKLAVFDGRIVQSRPKFSVEKGALSVTNAPFNAISATSSQHTYNIYVPSENVFVDRACEWSSTVYCAVRVQMPSVQQSAGTVLAQGLSLAAFPLNTLCSTISATINDTTTVINSQDVLKEVLRLTDYKDNRLQRTTPTYLDVYSQYVDGAGAINNPLGKYGNQTTHDMVPNGAFQGFQWTDATGTPLTGSSLTAVAPGTVYGYANGVPVQPASPATPIGASQIVTLYFRFRATEKIVLSPFTFADCHEWDTGLFGINNIQLVMNLRSPYRVIRQASLAYDSASATSGGYVVGPTDTQGGVFYNPNKAAAFENSVVNVQFLTPSLDVPLPPKSVVPYMEFPRYISQPGTQIAAGQTGQLVSQTITLPQIPDLFIIYAKPPQDTLTAQQSDYYLPCASRLDGVSAPLNVNFDNFSGLLSTVTSEQLYGMSVHNGLEMDWQQWIGVGATATGASGWTGSVGVGASFPVLANAGVPLTGGLLVLKPSQDITLQTGQAPSLVGNFTFQFQLTVKNNTGASVTPQLYVIAANSGFFESIRGSSRIIKGVLSEQDIISAPLAPVGTHGMLQRFAGGMKGMATLLSKTPALFSAKGSARPQDEAPISQGAGAVGGRKGRMSARLM